MTEDQFKNFVEHLAKSVRKTVENEMIKQFYKSPVLEDVFMEFNYSDLLDAIEGMAQYAMRSKK
jgi:hypothetical protein